MQQSGLATASSNFVRGNPPSQMVAPAALPESFPSPHHVILLNNDGSNGSNGKLGKVLRLLNNNGSNGKLGKVLRLLNNNGSNGKLGKVLRLQVS